MMNKDEESIILNKQYSRGDFRNSTALLVLQPLDISEADDDEPDKDR